MECSGGWLIGQKKNSNERVKLLERVAHSVDIVIEA